MILMYVLIALAALMSAAQAAEPSCAVAVDHPLIGEERWYGLYFEDDKIGHAVTAMTAQPDDGGSMIVQRFSMTLKLEQAEETITHKRRFDASPPHRLVDGTFESADRRIAYGQGQDGLHLDEGGVTRLWPGIDRDLCDEEEVAIHQFLADDPPIGTRLKTADIDVEHQVIIDATHDLEEVSTRRILGAEHVFHTLKTASSSEIFSYAARTLFQNREAVNLHLGPIELRAETEAIAHEPNRGVDLFAAFEKPLNKPLPRLSAIDALTLKAVVDEPSVAIEEVLTDAFGQRVAYLDQKTAIVRLANLPAPEETINADDFLRPTSSHPADHPRLLAMAAAIREPLGADVDDRRLAAALVDFVAGYIETVPESPYAYHTTSVFDVLDNRTGDCTEHSQLFVTLARAAGLPAREVSGFVYGGDHASPSLGGHAWVEVLIDGRWVGMDPTWEETELNRSHVQTRNVLVPSLSFEVVDVSYR